MMDTEQTTPGAEQANRPGLVRPQAGRVLAGVAQGIASQTTVPTWLVRLAFVLLSFAGGVGILLYIAGWLLIPQEGATEAIAGRWFDQASGPRAWIGIALIGFAVLVLANSTGLVDGDLMLAAVLVVLGVLLYRGDLRLGSRDKNHTDDEQASTTMSPTPSDFVHDSGTTPPPPSPPPPPGQTPPPASQQFRPLPPPPPPKPRSILGRLTFAVALITVGVMAFVDSVSGMIDFAAREYVGAFVLVLGIGLLIGTFFGRARGIIFLGIIVLPILFATPLESFNFDTDTVRYTPMTLADVRSEYTIDAGRMVLDLRNVEFTAATTDIDVSADMGEIVVRLPDDVAADAHASVGAGAIDVFGSTSGGLGDISRTRSVDGTAGSVSIDARVDLGRIEITRSGVSNGLEDFGTNVVTITNPAQLESDYTVNAGDFTLDLSNMSTLELDREVEVTMDVGTLRVILPPTTDVEVFASVDVGSIDMPDSSRDGLSIEDTYTRGGEAELTLDLTVDAGEIIVEETS